MQHVGPSIHWAIYGQIECASKKKNLRLELWFFSTIGLEYNSIKISMELIQNGYEVGRSVHTRNFGDDQNLWSMPYFIRNHKNK